MHTFFHFMSHLFFGSILNGKDVKIQNPSVTPSLVCSERRYPDSAWFICMVSAAPADS